MIDRIIEFDKHLMLLLNGWHSPFFDFLMPVITNKYTGIPIYLAILVILFRKVDMKKLLIAVAAILVTFALCDSLSVALFKETFQRLRPGWDPQIMDQVRMLEYKGGQYGFVSSHAANLFGLATITSLLIKNRIYTALIFFWAALVGYSRIYVGKHFPADVVCGAIFGMIVGYLVYKGTIWLCDYFRKRRCSA